MSSEELRNSYQYTATFGFGISMGDEDGDAAWLALLDDASASSAELLSVLFGSDSDVDAAAVKQTPSPSPSSSSSSSPAPAKKPRKRLRRSPPLRALLERLRLEAADLENVRALLIQRHEAPIYKRRGGKAMTPTMVDETDPALEHAWKATASRQLQRLSASKLENQQLRSLLSQQVGIAEQLVRLVQRAQRGLSSSPVPRPPVQPDVVTIGSHRRAELLMLARQMIADVDAVIADAALESLEHEFSQLTVREDAVTRREIPCGTILGGATAGRILPCATEAITDHLWKPQAVDHELISVQYNEHTADMHVTHYTITAPSHLGRVRLLGVSVRMRVRDESRDFVVSIGSMWPDVNMPYPCNAISYTTRDWIVAQRDPQFRDYSRVLVKTERVRFVHEHGAAAVTRDEAGLLRHSVEQANTIALDRTNRCLDALLLPGSGGTMF